MKTLTNLDEPDEHFPGCLHSIIVTSVGANEEEYFNLGSIFPPYYLSQAFRRKLQYTRMRKEIRTLKRIHLSAEVFTLTRDISWELQRVDVEEV